MHIQNEIRNEKDNIARDSANIKNDMMVIICIIDNIT